MAEPHDVVERPAGEAPGAGLPASFPAGPPSAPLPAEEPYRPLSLLALSGFGTAAVYAAVVLLLALVSFRSGKPLILGSWVWVVPLLAAWDCAVAWLRIARSEGTLAGGALARWGLMLAVFVGLGYGAYSLAVNLALRQQAEQFARDWLDQLRQGRLDQAIFRSVPPLQRADINEDDKDLLGQIALARGSGDESGAGPVRRRFVQMPLVSLVVQGGAQTTIEARGVKGWEFTRGGFEVAVGFHVDTPEASGEVVVTVHGMSAPNGEYAGRQWSVVLDKTGVDQAEGGIQSKPFGERIQRLTASAFNFLRDWHQKLTNDKSEAFLLSYPEEQRSSRRRALHRAISIGMLAGPAAVSAADLETLNAFRRFLAGPSTEGGLVEFPKDLTGDEDLRKVAEAMVRNLFNEVPAGPSPALEPQQSRPRWTRNGDKFQFAIGISLKSGPMITVDGTLVVEGDARILAEDVSPRWRFVTLKLESVSRRGPPGAGRQPRRGPGVLSR